MSSPEHRVKIAVATRTRPRRFVVECICGWSSPIYFTSLQANDAYREHKSKATEKARRDELYGVEAPF